MGGLQELRIVRVWSRCCIEVENAAGLPVGTVRAEWIEEAANG